MKVKRNLELVPFFKDIKRCQADVWLVTQNKDRLNLKSFLTQCLLIAMPDKEKTLKNSHLECDDMDKRILEKWCLL